MYKFDSNIYELLTETPIINNFYEKYLYKTLVNKKGIQREVVEDSLRYLIGKALSLGMIDKDKQIYYKNKAYYLFTEKEVRNRPLDFELVGGNYISYYLSKKKKHVGPKHLKFGENKFFFTSLELYFGILMGVVALLAILFSLSLLIFQKNDVVSNTSSISITSFESKTLPDIDELFTNSDRSKLKNSISKNDIDNARKKLIKSSLSTKQREAEEEVLVDVGQYLSITNDMKEVNSDSVEALQVILEDIDRIKNIYLRSQLQKKLNALLIESDLKNDIENKLYDYSLTESDLTSLEKVIHSLTDERFQEFKESSLAILKLRLREGGYNVNTSQPTYDTSSVITDGTGGVTTDPYLYQSPSQTYTTINDYQSSPTITYPTTSVDGFPY